MTYEELCKSFESAKKHGVLGDADGVEQTVEAFHCIFEIRDGELTGRMSMDHGFGDYCDLDIEDWIRMRDALLELFPLKVDTPTDSK